MLGAEHRTPCCQKRPSEGRRAVRALFGGGETSAGPAWPPLSPTKRVGKGGGGEDLVARTLLKNFCFIFLFFFPP